MGVYQKKKEEKTRNVAVLDVETLRGMAAKGLMNLSVQLGMEVLQQMIEIEVAGYAGEKGRHYPNRDGYRHGSERTTVVMGGTKVQTTRARVRKADGSAEIPLETLKLVQNDDPLTEAIVSKLLCGISCRKYARTADAGYSKTRSISKSEIQRRFREAMKNLYAEFFGRSLKDEEYRAIMLDGMDLGGNAILAAMGIRSDGTKHMLGLAQGGSENSDVVKTLLNDLLERGLTREQPALFVLDGGKALAKGVKAVFGNSAVIQRCQVHKKRNVLSHLPESKKADASKRISLAYMEDEYQEAKRRLELLARELDLAYPTAANSLREGMEETLTVHRLKLPGLLRQTLSSTNAIESANSVCAGIIRRVSNFNTGETALRHAAAGFMEAERSFRRIKGYRQLPILQDALLKYAGFPLTEIPSSATMNIA